MAEIRRWVPKWWAGDAGFAGTAVNVVAYPAEVGFRAVSTIRNRLYDAGWAPVRGVAVPVLSVGNLTVGGTGKTPMTAWLAGWLAERGRKPAVVMSGYGADETEVHRELNPRVPVHAARRRIEAAHAAAAGGADCIVLDDGFQHRRLARDVDIVLVAAEQWRGNRRLLPRGPWRERPDSLRRADFVVVTRKDASAEEAGAVYAELSASGYLRRGGIAHLAMGALDPLDPSGAAAAVPAGSSQDGVSIAGTPILALSSLAGPGSFEAQLRRRGALVDAMSFPDHHAFTDADVAEITRRGRGRAIVMTRKEAVKLRGRLPVEATAYVAGQEVVFERGRDDLERLVMERIAE